jgi:hypothetical protein
LQLCGQTGDHFGVVGGEVSVFVRVNQQVKELGAFLPARMVLGVTAELAVVGQQELPLAFDDPAVQEAVLSRLEATLGSFK